jgi:hypothetical protein
VVQASSQDAANQECFALAGWIQGSAIDGYYDLPNDYYWCNSIGA